MNSKNHIMQSQTQKNQKYPKNSDSDYKAEDEGSASDNQNWRKYKKTSYNFKMTKKDMIENSIRTLVPFGVSLKYEQKPSSQEYQRLKNISDLQEIRCNFKSMLAKVVQVIDGQHMKVISLIGHNPIKLTLRLNGITSPDIRKTETKQFSTSIKKILKQMLQDKIVRVETGEYEKSGNIYARVYAYTASPIHPYQCQALGTYKNSTQFCINDYLIQNDMAKGRGKNQFTKKNYQDFCQKYETKIWPVVEHYPLQFWKEKGENGDYQEREDEDDQ